MKQEKQAQVTQGSDLMFESGGENSTNTLELRIGAGIDPGRILTYLFFIRTV